MRNRSEELRESLRQLRHPNEVAIGEDFSTIVIAAQDKVIQSCIPRMETVVSTLRDLAQHEEVILAIASAMKKSAVEDFIRVFNLGNDLHASLKSIKGVSPGLDGVK